jgi:hypothetical protein
LDRGGGNISPSAVFGLYNDRRRGAFHLVKPLTAILAEHFRANISNAEEQLLMCVKKPPLVPQRLRLLVRGHALICFVGPSAVAARN